MRSGERKDAGREDQPGGQTVCRLDARVAGGATRPGATAAATSVRAGVADRNAVLVTAGEA